MKEQLKKELKELAHELSCASLWDSEMPTPERLASQEPFCVDTLAFEQWLQWIFIPKLTEMVDNPSFSGLPNQSDIHTMATYAFKDYSQNTEVICDAIKRVDTKLNHFIMK